MSAESPRHVRSGGPLTVPPQPPSDRSIIDAVSGFINDVTLSSSSTVDPKDIIQWARFETADINEPTPEGDSDNDISPLLLILGYGSGVQVWLIPPSGDAQEVLSWRQGTVRVLRILPTPQHGDCFASKRPLIALCDSASPGPTFCSLSFISIRGGEQVKSIKFKNPILDVLANKRSIVVSFSERFAVFDAATLEDRMTVTTCYPCPCPLGGSAPINPLALGDRWLAYADKKLNQSKRSSGGCEGEGVTSYTATVLHAAKSLSKGLRGLGESVAHSLGGGRSTSQSPSPPNADMQQPGVVTILDIESSDDEDCQDEEPYDPIVAHFVAHSEAIIALQFDASGMLLVTADRRGHDFHVFRVNPHPCGPGLAAVHHLYILHRGDTTAKVQDIAVSWDSRWAAVSTLRGTTHVFAISAYGGAPAVRTHTQPRVVNRLSRFHRSAGLPIAAQHPHAQPVPKRNSGSPVGDGISQGAWFPNPRLPPYPAPTTVTPLAQLRPTANLPTHTITRTSSGRQRLSSLSEDSNSAPLLARARFGVYVGGGQRAAAPVTALYLQAASGALLHLLLHPRAAANIPKEKVCDESPIEVEVEAAAQWPLQRPAAPAAGDLLAPLPPSNPLLAPLAARGCADMCMSEEERWLSQVEIVTHAGPHRRLWMGPQFVFKTYNCNGSSVSLSEAETVEVELSAGRGVARSNPVNMPGARPLVPVLVDSGSASSLEQSPSEGRRRSVAEGRPAACDLQLREDLAEAMREDHGRPASRREEAEDAEEAEEPPEEARQGVARAVDPLGCVVAAPAGPRAPPPPDLDRYTRANDDEARFRPVVRAPAALPLPAAVLARPLPRSTTIPVQSLAPPDPAAPAPAPPRRLHALTTDVVIPAALSGHWPDDHQLPSLPKSTRPPADIQSARIRPKKSPTPTSEADDCASCKTKCRDESEPTELPEVVDECDYNKARDRPETVDRIELSVPRKVRYNSVSRERAEKSTVSIENMQSSGNKIVTEPIAKTELEEPRSLREVSETSVAREIRDPSAAKEVKEPSAVRGAKKVGVDTSARKLNVGKDSRERSVDSNVREQSVVTENKPFSITSVTRAPSEPKQIKETRKNKKNSEIVEVRERSLPRESSQPKETKRSRETKESKHNKDPKNKAQRETTAVEIDKDDFEKNLIQAESVPSVKDVSSDPMLMKSFLNKRTCQTKNKDWRNQDIKTEEQVWDMLLNEPEKPIEVQIDQQTVEEKAIDESKPKSKRNRKVKKAQDDVQTKTEEDSFVEIHAIEEKEQPSSGELVSISTPYEDIEPSSFYISKSKKSWSPKNTSEKSEAPERKFLNIPDEEEIETAVVEPKNLFTFGDSSLEVGVMRDFSSVLKSKEKSKLESRKEDQAVGESSFFTVKELPKGRKSKSLSPYTEGRNATEKPLVTDVKDVYVIDTSKEDFPEIQITRGNKPRKRSPQPQSADKNSSITEVPVKSWSSIAASKSVKKVEEVEKKVEHVEKKFGTMSLRDELRDAVGIQDEFMESSSGVSLQDKLIELCKRTDIMVAECDAPSELNFVEEHHAVLHELPPLEPLDFGLDDFKLEVMRDSLLEINEAKLTSPICKINIDDILSSIRETTTKVIESSTFNLIDLEKVPAKREKGFSVVESTKITSQEVKLDDEVKSEEKDGEIMEKSSDDDLNSPPASTDSDKDDKKAITTSSRYEAEPEELSSSSFSSASRASLDPPSSPTPSCSGDNLLQFPGDSSSSV